MPLILGLETSCDETAAAVVEDGVDVRSSVVATQHDLHERYAGVVPEIASRAHVERLLPAVHDALDQAGVALSRIDAIAVGNRPGLIGSLIVGVAAAKALAWSLGKPLLGVDHVRAHLHAASLRDAKPTSPQLTIEHRTSKIESFLGLVVSGGHTSLYQLRPDGSLVRLGSTIDDAIGEAYDKAAVMLDAGYPGGPNLDRLAQSGDRHAPGIPELPISLLGPGSLDFSFSGLKTALLYAVRGRPEGRGKAATFPRTAADLSPQRKADLAAAFQFAAVEAIVRKLTRAVGALGDQGMPPQALVLGGGVSANSELRRRVQAFGEQHGLPVHLPALAYCVDNAAMIAGFAHHRLAADETDGLDLPVIATTRA
jgi:N6-L-threonylcarbamoyladenine synthase